MRHGHGKKIFDSRPHKLLDVRGRRVVLYFEKDPDRTYERSNVESSGFKALLVKQYDFRARGCGKARLKKLLLIKEKWEQGSGAVTPPKYSPSESFLTLGKVLDLTLGDIYFVHKS